MKIYLTVVLDDVDEKDVDVITDYLTQNYNVEGYDYKKLSDLKDLI